MHLSLQLLHDPGSLDLFLSLTNTLRIYKRVAHVVLDVARVEQRVRNARVVVAAKGETVVDSLDGRHVNALSLSLHGEETRVVLLL